MTASRRDTWCVGRRQEQRASNAARRHHRRGLPTGSQRQPWWAPKGLARRVRELVGDNGELILEFMVDVLGDDSARTADRLEAAKWLADRGFGKALQAVEVDVAPQPSLDFTMYSLEDLETMIAILEKYGPGRRGQPAGC